MKRLTRPAFQLTNHRVIRIDAGFADRRGNTDPETVAAKAGAECRSQRDIDEMPTEGGLVLQKEQWGAPREDGIPGVRELSEATHGARVSGCSR